MPSIKTLTPILGGSYYHLFNRGVNRQNIFYTEANYLYFLKLLNLFLKGYVHFLAYALLPNHFHLVIKVNDEISIGNLENLRSEGNPDNLENRSLSLKNGSLLITDEEEIGKLVVKQLKRMFITYAMAINKQENRTGNLFSPKYKRLEITDHDYVEYAIFYTHYNPVKHGLTDNFKNYKYSSYKAIAGNTITSIDRSLVEEIYGSKDNFIKYHNGWHEERSSIVLE